MLWRQIFFATETVNISCRQYKFFDSKKSFWFCGYLVPLFILYQWVGWWIKIAQSKTTLHDNCQCVEPSKIIMPTISNYTFQISNCEHQSSVIIHSLPFPRHAHRMYCHCKKTGSEYFSYNIRMFECLLTFLNFLKSGVFKRYRNGEDFKIIVEAMQRGVKRNWFCVYFRGVGSRYKMIEGYASHLEVSDRIKFFASTWLIFVN